MDLLQGRARGAYALTWDIGRAAVLSQSIGISYLAQCCGIQAEFQKFNYPQSSSSFPDCIRPAVQRVVRAGRPRHVLEFLRRIRRPDGSRILT